MLRRKQRDTALLDDIDLTLLRGVEQGLTWRALLASCTCEADETQLRILRLIHTGHLEGNLGEDSERISAGSSAATGSAAPISARARTRTLRPSAQSSARRASTARSASAPPAQGGAAGASTAPSAPAPGFAPPATGALRPPAQSIAPGAKTVPPSARSAHEALLRELAARRVSASLPPVRPSEPAANTESAPGYYCVRPGGAAAGPSDSSTPSAPDLEQVRRGITSAPPGRYSVHGSEPAHAASSAPPASAHAGFSSPLAALIDEFSRGQEWERACARRLSAALHEELSGNVQQAIAILHDLTAHVNDLRIRAERDRLQSLTAKATSGIYRSHALKAERASRHKEAAESWGKVLEACPDDAEAALHAASCSMELGDLKRAGTYARKAAELAPESVAAHRLLWRFFRKAGMEHSAIREREILRKLSKGG
jgi:hypothetical protein